jgi:cyanate permease
VLAAAVGLFWGVPITVYAFGIFLKPLMQSLHVSRAAVAMAFTLQAVMHSASAPAVGWLIGRFGTRRVIIPALALFASILIALGGFSRGIGQIYIAYAALGLVVSAVGPIAYGNVVTRWFDRRRGLALGLSTMGIGLGAVVMPVIAQHLIAGFGWRMAYALLGFCMLLLCVPSALILREEPRELGLSIDGDAPPGMAAPADGTTGLTVREAWRGQTFWLMACAFFLTGATAQGCVVHMAPMLSDSGLSAQTAALGSALLGGGTVIARVAAGYCLDRYFAPRVAIVFYGCLLVGIGLFLTGSVTHVAFAGAFFIGLGLGAEADIIPYLISRYFGLRAFAPIVSVAFAVFVLSGAVGPLLMGAGFDWSGTYRSALLLLFVATLLALIFMLRLGPYRFCARPPCDESSEANDSSPERSSPGGDRSHPRAIDFTLPGQW